MSGAVLEAEAVVSGFEDARALLYVVLPRMEDEMQQWFLAIFGVVAAGAGHLIKRWLERDPRAERRKLLLEALTLLRGLRRERLSLRELDQFVNETAPTGADTHQ